jgi:hypothetical protein
VAKGWVHPQTGRRVDGMVVLVEGLILESIIVIVAVSGIVGEKSVDKVRQPYFPFWNDNGKTCVGSTTIASEASFFDLLNLLDDFVLGCGKDCCDCRHCRTTVILIIQTNMWIF